MMSDSLIVPLEIAKFVFFAVYVGATIGVIIGVYWEGDQFAKEKQQRGWTLLIRSLAIDTLFTILVFGADGWINAIQRDEIIALETRLAPRVLSGEQLSDIAKKIKPFAGQEFEVSASADSESIELSCVLSDMLVGTGWHRETPTNSITVATRCGPSSINLSSGMSVSVTVSEAADPAAIALSDALTEAGILCHANRDMTSKLPLGRLALIVGAKP